jgi:hypothetical protein
VNWTIAESSSVADGPVAVDPLGRYVSVVSGDTLTILDLWDGLAGVASHHVPPSWLVAVHPTGTAVAALSHDGDLQLWRNGARERTTPAGNGEWLTFTADGRHLLLGSATAGEHARIDLFDAVMLERLDTAMMVDWRGDPLSDWGEGVEVACSTDQAAAVGFAANVGDDPHILAVAEVSANRLRVHGVDAEHSYTLHVPGERINGIALARRELFVLDNDGILSAFDWQAPGVAHRLVASGGNLLDYDEGFQLGGSLFVRDDVVALDVVHEEHLAAVVLLDARSGQRRRSLELPVDWHNSHAYIDNGFLRRTDGGNTHFAAIRLE